MKISSARPPAFEPTHTQAWFLPPDVKKYNSSAEKRVLYGRLAEEVVLGALNITPCAIDGSCDYCPDGYINGGGLKRYVEIKSSGKNKQLLVYKWRLEKDKKLFAMPEVEDLLYVLVHHAVAESEWSVEDNFRNLYAERGVNISVLRLHDVVEAVEAIGPARPFSFMNGQTGSPDKTRKVHGTMREGYKDGGWRVPMKLFAERIQTRCPARSVSARLSCGRACPVMFQSTMPLSADWLR